MKKTIAVYALALLAMGCADDKDGAKSNTDIPGTFAPIIKGTWVMTDYITDLQKTKSPKASSAKLNGVVSMEIDPSTSAGDTIIVSGSLNNHEGVTFYTFWRQGQNEQSLQTAHTDADGSFYELSYEAKNNDTQLVLNHYGTDKKLLDKRSFTKVTGPLTADSEPYGLQYMANRAVLAGKYAVTDAAGTTTNATFTDDGMVQGIGTHTTYYIFTDFLGDVETNMDEMMFDPQTKNQKPYVFETSGDTIRLYKALENEERTELVRGPLNYTMVKK